MHTATRKERREGAREFCECSKEREKSRGFKRSRFSFVLRARKREREREREKKRGPKSSSLSLLLFRPFLRCSFLVATRGEETQQYHHQRGSEKRPQLERDFSAPIKENREKMTMHFARTPHRGALVFSRTFRIDFPLTIVFYRVMSATISIRRAVPPVPFVRVNARVFARNKRRKSTLLLLLMCSRFCLVFEESVFFFIRHKKGKKGKTSSLVK